MVHRGGAFKLACVDCDNTIWFGVVGEDGPAGLVGNVALQERLLSAKKAGVLLVTVSKNTMGDVEAAFKAHPEWPLKHSDFVAHKVNWTAKSQNIADVLVELNLSTFASVVFIDDNPVEVAEVVARCPGIHALNVPSQPDKSQHAAYASQMWPLDVFKSTREDALRMANFEQDGARQAQRGKAATFGEYIASLNVQCTLSLCADKAEEERVVQVLKNSLEVFPRSATGDAGFFLRLLTASARCSSANAPTSLTSPRSVSLPFRPRPLRCLLPKSRTSTAIMALSESSSSR